MSEMNELLIHVCPRLDVNKIFTKPKKNCQTFTPPKNGNVEYSMVKSDVLSKTIELDQSACYSTKEHPKVLSSSLPLF